MLTRRNMAVPPGCGSFHSNCVSHKNQRISSVRSPDHTRLNCFAILGSVDAITVETGGGAHHVQLFDSASKVMSNAYVSAPQQPEMSLASNANVRGLGHHSTHELKIWFLTLDMLEEYGSQRSNNNNDHIGAATMLFQISSALLLIPFLGMLRHFLKSLAQRHCTITFALIC